MLDLNKVIIDRGVCVDCGYCVPECPKEAIETTSSGAHIVNQAECEPGVCLYACLEICPVCSICTRKQYNDNGGYCFCY